jgi:hypothetical protein
VSIVAENPADQAAIAGSLAEVEAIARELAPV